MDKTRRSMQTLRDVPQFDLKDSGAIATARCIPMKTRTRGNNMDAVLKGLSPIPAGNLYLILMRRANGGHAIAVELNSRYPQDNGKIGLYQFMDANLGLFAFRKSNELFAFVVEQVWKKFYRERYDSFRTVEFNTGAGGFGTSPTAAEEDAALEAELAALLEESD